MRQVALPGRSHRKFLQCPSLEVTHSVGRLLEGRNQESKLANRKEKLENRGLWMLVQWPLSLLLLRRRDQQSLLMCRTQPNLRLGKDPLAWCLAKRKS